MSGTRSTDAALCASSKKTLKGSLGIPSILFMVVATAAPLTVMVANTPLLMSMGNGAAAPVDAFVATVIMLLFTIGFVAIAKYLKSAGAFYACIQKGLGRAIGLGAASLAIASYFLILVALEAYFGYAMGELLNSLLGMRLPWWLITGMIVAAIGWLGYQHIEFSSKLLALALILEIAVVLVVNVAVLMGNTGQDAATTVKFSLQAFGTGSPGLGILFAVFSFIGFESTVIFREEVRDPEKTIPRATYLAVLIVGVFYIVSMYCEVLGIGAANVKQMASEHPGDLYLILTEQYLGKVAVDVVQVLLVTSLFACILSLHNIIVRYQYVLGQYGVLHKSLGNIHERHGSPHVSSFVQTAYTLLTFVVLAAAGLDPVTGIYAWGATAGTIGYMVILALSSAAVIAFFARRPDSVFWRTTLAPLGGIAGICACLWVAIDNLPSLIGGDHARLASNVVLAVIAGAFAAGFAAAACLRRWLPLRYEGLKSLS